MAQGDGGEGAGTMGDLSWMRTRTSDEPCAWPLEDLNDLYCRTRVAEAQAEAGGFSGTAAALAAIATAMAEAPGVNRKLAGQLMARSASLLEGVSPSGPVAGGSPKTRTSDLAPLSGTTPRRWRSAGVEAVVNLLLRPLAHQRRRAARKAANMPRSEP